MTRSRAAQLDREIAQALSHSSKRAHAVQRIGAKKPPKRRTDSSKKQAKLLADANRAALAGEYVLAEKLLSKGKQRTIATAFNTITPESAAESDYAELGWVDEEGDPIEVDADDIAEEREFGSDAPVTSAIARKAVHWLRDAGAYEASSSSYGPGVWYSSESTVSNYGTGEERSEDFFLRNFTPDEEVKIFSEFKRGRR